MTKKILQLLTCLGVLATGFDASYAQLGDAVAVQVEPVRGGSIVLSRPINGQVTITQSGSFVVTWDISVITPPAITVLAPNVNIDLNGHTVGTPGFDNGTIILLGAGSRQLKIKNGRLVGGRRCVSSVEPAIRFSMDHVTCTDGRFGVDLPNASSISIRDSVFSSASQAVNIEGAFDLQFESNTVTQAAHSPAYPLCGASFQGISKGVIRGNVLSCTSYNGTVLSLTGTGAIRVENNTLSGFDTQGCIHLGSAATVKDNVIEGCRYAITAPADGSHMVRNQLTGLMTSGNGILIQGSDNAIADNILRDFGVGIVVSESGNTVSGNTVLESLEVGVSVSGTLNLIDGNRIQSTGGASPRGLRFSEGSADNLYRNNDFRGNAGVAVEDYGTNNIDAGGNLW